MNISQIKKILGNPYFESKDCLIYNLDCLEAMKILPSSIVDLIVTSPPYNIGKEYEKNLPIDQYISWCSQWISEIYRLACDRGSFWLNLGYLSLESRAKAIPISYLLWDKIPFYLIQEIVWNYGAGVAGKKFFSPRNEKFLWYVKNHQDYIFNLDDIRDPNVKYPNQKKNGKIKVNPLGKNPTDVWQFPKVTSGKNRSSKERTDHPAQFPIDVIDRIIKASSHPENLILDPFMGSGTTAEAALRNGRKVIGFEIKLEYCYTIAKRLENSTLIPVDSRKEQYSKTNQLSLF
ncbi:MAG: site-specific DNA-methyltransferase [Cyanobacteria bacterium SBLK]|nr:site-specific DNA-methyltransferase [Cyanobacteria bacterium SBLK]